MIKEWKFYNRFCNSSDSRFSLFFLQKRIFKVFSKESKQDLYSSKIMLDKSFSLEKNLFPSSTYLGFYYSHISFCYLFNNASFCIHCGMNY